MAGVRGRTQYTLASWLTLETPTPTPTTAPAPTSVPDTAAGPPDAADTRNVTTSPSPYELLASKLRQRTSGTAFTLQAPPAPPRPYSPSLSPQEQPPPPPSPQETSRVDPLDGPEVGKASHPPPTTSIPRFTPTRRTSQPRESSVSPGRWQRGGEVVCGACLAALSLPDVHSPHFLQYGAPLAPPRYYHQHPLHPLNRSFRRHRLTHAWSAEGEATTQAPDSFSTFKSPSRGGVAGGIGTAGSVYRSLERGTRRRPLWTPLPPWHPPQAVQSFLEEITPISKHPPALPPRRHGQPSSPSGPPLATVTGRIVSKPPAPPLLPSPSTLPSSISRSPAHTLTSPPIAPPSASSTATGKSEKCSCTCENHHARASGGGSDDVCEGEVCEADIETQATQIIDMVELHAESPCKPS